MSDSVFIGIDVSSQTLEIASSDRAKTWQLACCTSTPSESASSSHWPTPSCNSSRPWCCVGANWYRC